MRILKSIMGVLALTQAVFGVADTSQEGRYVTGPGYPPPNGVTFNAAGNAGRAGGLTFAFSNVNLAGLVTLDWGPVAAIHEALDGAVDSAGETLTLAAFTDTTAVWTGVSRLYIAYSAPLSTPTRLTLRLSGAAKFIEVAGAGIRNGNGVVAQVSGDFACTLLFEASNNAGVSYEPVLDLVDRLHTIPPSDPYGVMTDFSGGFWWIPQLWADFNSDGDVDASDLDAFASCISGPAIPHNGTPACRSADRDRDGDVDQADFGQFQRCYGGSGLPPNPACPQ